MTTSNTIKEDIKLRSDVLFHIFEAKEAAKKLDNSEYISVLDNMIEYFNLSMLNVVNQRVGYGKWEAYTNVVGGKEIYEVIHIDKATIYNLGPMSNIEESIDAAVEFIGIAARGE